MSNYGFHCWNDDGAWLPRAQASRVARRWHPELAGVNLVGYNSSKSALNMITVSYAKELAAHGIKVNAANLPAGSGFGLALRLA